MKKFSQIFQYNPLSSYEGLYGKYKCRAGTTYIGVEIELEEVDIKSGMPSSIKMTTDGSLKLSGQEFITIPIKFCYLEQELDRLFGTLSHGTITSRCSTHIHMNVRDMTSQELVKLILIYMLYEKSLFHLSGDRWENIFCVPYYNYPLVVNEMINDLLNEAFSRYSWSKYYALNLAPIWGSNVDGEGVAKLGTVEFRHHKGTKSTSEIIQWVNFLVSLKIAAKKFSLGQLMDFIEEDKTDDQYVSFARLVFREFTPFIIDQPTFKQDMVDCNMVLKKIMLSNNLLIKKEILCVVS